MSTTLLQPIKHEFMAYRNGIVADTLRKAGYPQSVIFGLNLPQLTEIARRVKERAAPDELSATARELWSDKNVRESRLLAAYLLDPAMPLYAIETICADVQTPEEADILVFRWLRHSPHAADIAIRWQPLTAAPYPWLTQALSRFLPQEQA